MSRKIKLICLVTSVVALASCISTAENIIDGVAAQGGKGLAAVVISVDKERCTADPYIAGKVVMFEAELSEEISVRRVKGACAKKFDIDLNTEEFSRGYRDELRERCDATLVRPDETNQYAKLTNTYLCDQLPEFQS